MGPVGFRFFPIPSVKGANGVEGHCGLGISIVNNQNHIDFSLSDPALEVPTVWIIMPASSRLKTQFSAHASLNASGIRALKILVLTLSVYLMLAATVAPPAFASPNAEWVIRKTEWSATDEKNFADFITAIANSNCHTVDSCFKSSANPYRASDDPRSTFGSDCGRFPFLLRTYFAWKNGLPMSVVANVGAVDGLGSDLRYSPKGNYVKRRLDIVPQAGRTLYGMSAIASVMNTVSTAVYRYNAELDQPNSSKFFDFTPAKIDRDSIHAGTIIYDANGHAAIVYKVGDDGRVFYIDAHPGDTVSRGTYGQKFVRSSPASGGGFKNFRPLKLTGATRQADGTYVGGRITTIPMSAVPSFSMEQFYGTEPSPDGNWKKARFSKANQPLPFYDWIRSSLAVGDLKYEPIIELQNSIESLCGDLQDRVIAVQDAIDHDIENKSQPSAMPENIYGASGEWENFSSPSRDARLKTSFVEIRQEIQKYIALYQQKSSRVVYNGNDLIGDLRTAYEASANACVIQYKRTDGSDVRLNYSHIALRLFSLSFDPYQCVERRWGATDPQELATCRDDSTKRAWYDAEQALRNQIDRPYDQKMGFTLGQLRAGAPGSGVRTPPDVDLRGYLYSL